MDFVEWSSDVSDSLDQAGLRGSHRDDHVSTEVCGDFQVRNSIGIGEDGLPLGHRGNEVLYMGTVDPRSRCRGVSWLGLALARKKRNSRLCLHQSCPYRIQCRTHAEEGDAIFSPEIIHPYT